MVALYCTYGYLFLYGNKRKISEYCQSPLILLKCMGCNTINILLPFNFLFVSNQIILKRKSVCQKTIETITIVPSTPPTSSVFYLIPTLCLLGKMTGGEGSQKYFQNQHFTRYNVPWAFSFLHTYSIHWVNIQEFKKSFLYQAFS